MNAHNPPRPYDLTQPDEVARLLRETRGYLHACRLEHHGTDFEGRMYAEDGLIALLTDRKELEARVWNEAMEAAAGAVEHRGYERGQIAAKEDVETEAEMLRAQAFVLINAANTIRALKRPSPEDGR